MYNFHSFHLKPMFRYQFSAILIHAAFPKYRRRRGAMKTNKHKFDQGRFRRQSTTPDIFCLHVAAAARRGDGGSTLHSSIPLHLIEARAGKQQDKHAQVYQSKHSFPFPVICAGNVAATVNFVASSWGIIILFYRSLYLHTLLPVYG